MESGSVSDNAIQYQRVVERVLVVEDNRRLRSTLASAMWKRGWQTQCCGSVSEAIGHISEAPPDLILLDVALPDGRATDVVRVLDSIEPRPSVVVISGKASREETFELARQGVRAYLDKPLALAELDAKIDAVLSSPPDIGPHVCELVGHKGIHAVQDEVRDIMLREAIARSTGNRRGAARLLHISRQLVQHMLRKVSPVLRTRAPGSTNGQLPEDVHERVGMSNNSPRE